MPESSFVTTLDLNLAEKLRSGLIEQGFDLTKPPHTLFSGKKKGISCTLYQSGKLVVQGKESKAFVEFFLEPEILQTVSLTYQHLTLDTTPKIGIDESGKGDFFGPLCIAGVYAGGDMIVRLQTMGVRDSKTLSDSTIRKLAKQIREACMHHIVRINPQRYNELYAQFKNLNQLLAWGHATTIESLVIKSNCHDVIIDQFAAEHVVVSALSRKKLEVNLTQRHRGEEEMVVAAASILARDAFIEGLERLETEFSISLPKGASAATIQAGKKLVKQHGEQVLSKVGKLHFKTVEAIFGVT